MAKRQRLTIPDLACGTSLVEVDMSVADDPRIESKDEDNNILWMRPGVDRNLPVEEAEHLFGNYSSICRAEKSCDLRPEKGEKRSGWVSKTMHFDRGQVIAATTTEKERVLEKLLEKRGVKLTDISFGEGPLR